MNTHDLPLIIYTLCLQSAVGVYVVSRMVAWTQAEKAQRMRFMWLVGGLGVAGVIASFLHMGYPWNAALTMTNLGTSWLSREIVLTVSFGASWLVSLLLERQGVGSIQVRNAWATWTSLLGLGLVFVMSMIYRTTAFPAWEHGSTTVGFYATAGLIGTAVVFAAQCCKKAEEEPKALTALVIGGVAMLALQMAAVASQGAYLGSAGPEAAETAALLAGPYAAFHWARVILVVVGTAILMPLAWRQWAQKKVASMPGLAGALVALVVVGELVGRILFYSTRVKIGL
ncbi:MAG TPA: DmsC/YnfH family molybdoenzyme membrane anchor subunit [Symbiobacteriaceae bacterium]|nr:DmsC/YnfH family molybdoenzyme membrane anchor subunit [Symbiobacteriaceae bacterium]